MPKLGMEPLRRAAVVDATIDCIGRAGSRSAQVGRLHPSGRQTHETHFSAIEPGSQGSSRLSQPHGNQERPSDPEPPSCKRPQEPFCLIQMDLCPARFKPSGSAGTFCYVPGVDAHRRRVFCCRHVSVMQTRTVRRMPASALPVRKKLATPSPAIGPNAGCVKLPARR